MTADKSQILKKVDDVNVRVRGMIVRAKSDYDIYNVIAERAKIINKVPRTASVWGNIQREALESLVLNICKAFDKAIIHRQYEQNSIEHVIKLLLDNEIQSENLEVIKEFQNKYADVMKSQQATVVEIEKLYRSFRSLKEDAFNKLLEARDSLIAHSDHNKEILSTASIDDMEKILIFGYDFCSMIALSFNNVQSPSWNHIPPTGKFLKEIMDNL